MLRVVIPAAGASSRSGLPYPKTLYPLNGIPIIVRLCKIFFKYDTNPIVIINPSFKNLFLETFTKFKIAPQLIFQNQSLGMGNALLQVDKVVNEDDDILLIWSDIPLISPTTIDHLVNCHTISKNDFSFITAIANDCYTIVKRDNGNIKSVIETRALNMPSGKNTEREIGIFLFKKGKIFKLLQNNTITTLVNGRVEQGFLSIIEKVVENKLKIEGYPLAAQNDLLSFNTPADLSEIEKINGLS